MEVKVSMSYLDDEKYSVKNVSGNELVVDMYARDKKENLSPMELLLSAVTTCAAVEVVSMIKKRRRDFKDIKAETSGVRADTHPMYYKEINVKYIIYSNDLKDNEADDKFDISNVVLTNSSTDPGIAAELSSFTA